MSELPNEQRTISGSGSLAATVGFDLVGSELGRDIESALQTALNAGAVFSIENNPLSIFRHALADSIRNIEMHPRGRLLQDFLLKGPYEDRGEIPGNLVGKRLSDTETASAITFIYSYMVNCFKGAVAELLATKACSILLKQLQQQAELPTSARLYIGDIVGIRRIRGKGFLKGADQHILIGAPNMGDGSNITVAGVSEVKSYICSAGRLRRQLDQHLRRAERGMRVAGVDYPTGKVHVGSGKKVRPIYITVLPSNWKLPRSFRFENSANSRLLHIDQGAPPQEDDEIKQTGDKEWRITLRWSKEALAAAAFEMTFWYMEKVGEVIYSEFVPDGWEKMTQAEAGRNAAKMMLYYALLRCRTVRDEQRAIALYNNYGFGYALGMNFKNANGKREMLWPQDLEEISSVGKTKHGCYLR